MDISTWLGIVGGLVVSYALILGLLAAFSRTIDARTAARFVPDCAVLFKRLAADPRVALRWKVPLLLLVAYLAMPFDLVPDFIPVVGLLDDALLVALALRALTHGGSRNLIAELWPGPEPSLRVILTLAGRPS